MNIVVNGASGYIGCHIVNELLSCGHNVFAVCRKKTGRLSDFDKNRNLNIIYCTQDSLELTLKNAGIDLWYQLSWEGANNSLRSEPMVQLKNEMMSVNALETAVKIGCKKIIYTGTVYERAATNILNSPKFNKNSFYIISKKHLHEVTYQLSKKYDIGYVWCQFCHPIGIGMAENQMIPSVVKAFVKCNDIVFGECNQVYDILSVKNLARAFRILGENENKKNFYYIGSGNPKTLKEYIQETARICQYTKKLSFGVRNDDGMRYKKEWFDSSEFIGEFGTYEVESYEEAILELVKAFKTTPHN